MPHQLDMRSKTNYSSSLDKTTKLITLEKNYYNLIYFFLPKITCMEIQTVEGKSSKSMSATAE